MSTYSTLSNGREGKNKDFYYDIPLENEDHEGDPTISRNNVVSVLEQMYGGSLINKGYFKYILDKSNKLLYSIDSLYT
jgi:hypothetical protein